MTTMPSRTVRNGAVVIVVAAVVSAWIGAAMAPTLVARHPLVLTALNANNRYLILATNQLDAWSFYSVALTRRVVPTVAFFYIGHWYGGRAVGWLERRDPASGEAVRFIERIFDRAGWWVVAIAPMTMVGLIAGASKFRPSRFIPLIVVSIAARLVALRLLGQAFSGPVDRVVAWIDRWRGPLLVVTVGIVLATAWSQKGRRGRSFEELASLDEDDVEQVS